MSDEFRARVFAEIEQLRDELASGLPGSLDLRELDRREGADHALTSLRDRLKATKVPPAVRVGQSAQYCGCDPGANWICERHRAGPVQPVDGE
jgi:hypothetical protein